MLHDRTQSMLACHIIICVHVQGMLNQRSGALVDVLVGIPEDADAMQASLNYYVKRINSIVWPSLYAPVMQCIKPS